MLVPIWKDFGTIFTLFCINVFICIRFVSLFWGTPWLPFARFCGSILVTHRPTNQPTNQPPTNQEQNISPKSFQAISS
jgi:hypothetical protein